MTALMGTTGAGKTTLMDLLACRKNSAPALLKHLLARAASCSATVVGRTAECTF